MSAKREAPYLIDEHNIQAIQQSEKKQIQKLQINQRKIITVKKDEKQQPSLQEKNKQIIKQKAPLFGSLFSSSISSNGSGLFGNKFDAPSLFGNNKNIISLNNSLFSNNKTQNNQIPKQTGLFSSSSKNTTSIFNFQSSGVPPIKKNSQSLFGGLNNQNEGEDEGNSAQLEADQNIQADPSKSAANYKYEQSCKIILSQRAFKYKKNSGELVQNVQIVIQEDLTSKLSYLIVRLPATKKQIFTGLIIQNKSQVKHINNKKQNVEVSVFSFNKQMKVQKNNLRFQFQKSQSGSNLKHSIDKIINIKQKSLQVSEQKSIQQQNKQQSISQLTKKHDQKN